MMLKEMERLRSVMDKDPDLKIAVRLLYCLFDYNVYNVQFIDSCLLHNKMPMRHAIRDVDHFISAMISEERYFAPALMKVTDEILSEREGKLKEEYNGRSKNKSNK